MIAALFTRLPHDVRAPNLARRALERLAGELGADERRDASLLITEVVSNAVRHSHGTVPIELGVLIDESVVRTEVCDPSADAFEPAVREAPARRESGWGLYLVDAVSERWGVDRARGACVWFELSRPPRPAAPQAPRV